MLDAVLTINVRWYGLTEDSQVRNVPQNRNTDNITSREFIFSVNTPKFPRSTDPATIKVVFCVSFGVN
jgi:hypothetical protein